MLLSLQWGKTLVNLRKIKYFVTQVFKQALQNSFRSLGIYWAIIKSLWPSDLFVRVARVSLKTIWGGENWRGELTCKISCKRESASPRIVHKLLFVHYILIQKFKFKLTIYYMVIVHWNNIFYLIWHMWYNWLCIDWVLWNSWKRIAVSYNFL